MAKETKKGAKAPKTTKTPKVEVPPTEETVVVETTETTGFSPQQMIGSTGSSLDANHRVDLIHLMDDVFRKDPNAEKRFTLELRESMNQIVVMGIVASLADEARFGNSTFTAVLSGTAYPQLVVAAHTMGIKLPDIKALEVKENGTVEIPSSEFENVNEEAAKQMDAEHKIETEGDSGSIELDPVKVAKMDEDALKKALSYILITGPKLKKSVKDTLVSCVDFMRDYRMAQADSAEKPAEVKDKLDSRSVYDWLNDAFSYVKPTHLLSGIGVGMKVLVETEKNGVSAFMILRGSLTDKETGVPCWDDQSIADAARAITKWSCEDSIAKDTEKLNALDPKAKDYKKTKEGFENSIAHYKSIIDDVTNPNFNIIDDMENLLESGNHAVVSMAARIRNAFYPETVKKPASDYKNLYNNIKQRAGIIANMFREPGNFNQNYSEANLSDLVEYTEEEKVELRKSAAEAKKEESKNA